MAQKTSDPSQQSKEPVTQPEKAGEVLPQDPQEMSFKGSFFRRTDWIAFLIAFVIAMIGYLWTLAPDITLEDSGELAVGSWYAGVPHPPGYPVWTLYTWFFTQILPFSNIAWRVGVSSAFAAALSCGLLALMISRGSSLMLEGMQLVKSIQQKWEDRLCLVAGVTGGLLLAFNGFMWSQAVIVEVYAFSVLSFVGVLCLLMRWLYDTDKWRYLYLAFFLFGICFTNHQTMVVGAMGIEILVMLAHPRLGRDLFLANSIIYLIGLLLKAKGMMVNLDNNLPMFVIFNLVGIGSIAVTVALSIRHGLPGWFWKKILLMGSSWMVGVLFYFYMPIASMTNPPMNWGYPRTWDGFIHTITRGQYENANPTNSVGRFLNQIRMYTEGAIEEFGAVYLLIGLVPLIFLPTMRRKERAWFTGLASIFLFLSVLLLVLLNPETDRQSRDLHRVFFISSHVIIAMGAGYGLAMIGGVLSTHYQDLRQNLLWAGSAATGIALFFVVTTFESTYFPLLRLSQIVGFLIPLIFMVAMLVYKVRAPLVLYLILVAVAPIQSILGHWSENEQRGHLFGFWFGHDMFKPPFKDVDGGDLYPEMAREAILFGGTDPGRFNPTYMIFCESQLPPSKKRDPEFNRRDVYLITQNALADGTYLSYIRAHYNRSAQTDPPFFQEMLGGRDAIRSGKTNFLAKWVRPLDEALLSWGKSVEKKRWVGPSFFEVDHLLDKEAFVARLNDPKTPMDSWLRGALTEETGTLLASNPDSRKAMNQLVKDLNDLIEGEILYAPDLFKEVTLSESTQALLDQQPTSFNRIRLNRLLLEESYPGMILESKGGVYPDREIQTPSGPDSQVAFEDYVMDAQRRLQLNQLLPGEDVSIVDDQVAVRGQVAVMAINALLTRKIFDANPGHEFYIEESFPLEWMYPHLSPYGVIMKLNREPLEMLTEDMVRKDHLFWRQYSERLIGDWISYDTTVQEICDFAIRVYLHHDFTGLDEGQRKFARDDNAQKAFSKLRSSLGGLYAWRVKNAKGQEEKRRMMDEADFAFRQSFAYCPYSPEALFRYANLLMTQARLDEALILAETSLRFDEENRNVQGLVENLRQVVDQKDMISNSVGQIDQMMAQLNLQPTNAQLAFDLASAYLSTGNTNGAVQALDILASSTETNTTVLLSVADAYRQLGLGEPLESIFIRIIQLMPGNPEAWYDLAGIQSILNKTNPAIQSLKMAIQLSNRRIAQDPNSGNLHLQAVSDERFNNIRDLPEFQALFE